MFKFEFAPLASVAVVSLIEFVSASQSKRPAAVVDTPTVLREVPTTVPTAATKGM